MKIIAMLSAILAATLGISSPAFSETSAPLKLVVDAPASDVWHDTGTMCILRHGDKRARIRIETAEDAGREINERLDEIRRTREIVHMERSLDYSKISYIGDGKGVVIVTMQPLDAEHLLTITEESDDHFFYPVFRSLRFSRPVEHPLAAAAFE